MKADHPESPPSAQLAQGTLKRVTYHAVYDDSIIDALRFAKDSGFAGIQVGVETPHLAFERLSRAERDEIAAFRAQNGLMVSLHGPDEAVSLFESNSRLAEGIFKYYCDLFQFAHAIGSNVITIHLGAAAEFPTDAQPQERMPAVDAAAHQTSLGKNLRRLVDLAGGRFTLCVENYRLEPTAIEVLDPLVESGAIALCWDIAKTYDSRMSLDRQLDAYFIRHLARVRQVHLHDIRDGRGHKVIGTGEVDFPRFLRYLAVADVREYCIEVRPREKAVESLVNLRSILAG